MRNSHAVLLALFVLIGALASTGCDAEENRSSKNSPASQAEIQFLGDATMDKLAQTATASEHHRIFTELVGQWDYELKFWSGRDAKPQKSRGTMDNKLELSDRYLFGTTVVILNIGGQIIPYEGRYTLGYDAGKNAYTSALADTMHPGMLRGTGTYDAERNILEEKGSFTHPLTGKASAYRSELRFNEEGGHTRSVFIPDASGKEFKVLEMAFSR